jgi:tetraacyldisaccharide 4'-kinase
MKINRPLFWNNINLISILLYPLSLITFLVNKIKKIPNKKNFKIKSICVGNLYVGGTGKTPLSIKINNILKKKYKTVFIKKKYSDQIDEQNILKSYGNLICREHRDNALKIATKQKYDVAILDDGLQDKSLNYNITIACFNSSDGIGNSFLIPSGPLREDISEIKNYDAVFLNGEKSNKEFSKYLKKLNNDIKVFEAKYTPTNLRSFNLKKKFLFFCGLGNPSEFERTLNKYKFKIKEKIIFPDHYDFSDTDIFSIKKLAKRKKLNIITTEKDYLRLNKKNRKNVKFLKIDLSIKNMQNFSKFLIERL